MAYCRVLLCNINKKSSCCNGGFLFISNKHLVTFHFPLAIYPYRTDFLGIHKHPDPIIYIQAGTAGIYIRTDDLPLWNLSLQKRIQAPPLSFPFDSN